MRLPLGSNGKWPQEHWFLVLEPQLKGGIFRAFPQPELANGSSRLRTHLWNLIRFR